MTHKLDRTDDQYSDVFLADEAASDTTPSQQQQQQPLASMTSAEDDDEEQAAAEMWDADDLATICGSSVDNDDEDDEINPANVEGQAPMNDVRGHASDDG